MMKRRTFIKTGMLFVPTIVCGQDFTFADLALVGQRDSTGEYDPAIIDWAARVVTNGGAAPSTGTKDALNTFYLGLVSNSLLSKMISVNCFAPDNSVASFTPLIKVSGNDPWTNSGFIAGDLNIDGLRGHSGSNTYLNTGVVPSTDFSNSTSVGLTIYNSANNTDLCEFDIGCCANPSNSSLTFYHSCGGTDYFDCYQEDTTGRISGSDSAFLGYVSANRTASNAVAIYKASSGTAHTTVASGSGSAGTRPAFSIYLYTRNRNGSAEGAFSIKRYSFCGIHLGLTSGESSTFFNLIQAMRTSLGGGYV